MKICISERKYVNKLKELASKLTGKTIVQGKTICDILEFITNNYSTSGGSGGTSVSGFYLYNGYLYKDNELTIKVTADEYFEASMTTSVYIFGDMADSENVGTYTPIFSNSVVDDNGYNAIKVYIMLENGTLKAVYTAPFEEQSGAQ